MTYINLLSSFIVGILLILNSGCSHKDSIQTFNDTYYKGDLHKAYKFAKKKYDSKDDMVLWGFKSGIVASQLKQDDSFEILDTTEQVFNKYEQEGLISGIFSGAAAVIVNENVKTYRGNIYEGVLLNYYKALVLMQQGNKAGARVEFNRANDRQRRAKDYFNKDIQKALANQEKQNRQNNNLKSVNVSQTSNALDSVLRQQYSNLNAYKAYKNFINPVVSYMSALFFMLESDWAKALDLYKESYGMTDAKVIDKDMQILESRRKHNKSPYTWFIIEDGKSPVKEEILLNIPTYLVSNNVLHAGIALPKLKNGEDFYQNLFVYGNTQNVQASLIADFEGVITNEFNEQLSFIVARATSSAILKAITQSILSEQFGVYGSLAGMVYSVSTTSADVRISSVLPRKVFALQIQNQAGEYHLMGNNRVLLNFEISDKCHEEQNQHKLILCQKNDNILYIRLRPTTLSIQRLRGQN